LGTYCCTDGFALSQIVASPRVRKWKLYSEYLEVDRVVVEVPHAGQACAFTRDYLADATGVAGLRAGAEHENSLIMVKAKVTHCGRYAIRIEAHSAVSDYIEWLC